MKISELKGLIYLEYGEGLRLNISIHNADRMYEDLGVILNEYHKTSYNKAMLKLFCAIKMLSGQSGFTDDQRLTNVKNYIDGVFNGSKK